MCIVAFAWQVLDETPLCLISNRDEFYHRPTAALYSWENSPIIAGQDLQSGGTWMGVTEQGRWAVVTNFRDGLDQKKYFTSRGALIQSFLESTQTPIRFAQSIEKNQCDYAGFNLFVGDRDQAVYMSNRGEAPQVLPKGVFVVSNGLMSEDWEKTRHLRKRFTQELLPMMQLRKQLISAASFEADIQHAVWDILQDERKVTPKLLPETGVNKEMEALLSSTFIQSPVYGTRCSNLLIMSNQHMDWIEKNQQGQNIGELVHQSIKLK